MPQQRDQDSDPSQFIRLNSDDRHWFRQRPASDTVFSAVLTAFSVGKIVHDPDLRGDKKTVSAFLRHAVAIFAASRAAGPQDRVMAILTSRDGGVHRIAGADRELEPIRQSYGASAAYCVNRIGERLKLEARQASDSGALAAESPAHRWNAPRVTDWPIFRRTSCCNNPDR